MREIHWEGDSKDVLSAFPVVVKLNLGYSLRRLQKGMPPACDTRSMSSVGKGVYELKEMDERSWYRVLYLANAGSGIYVLHCFEKHSRKTSKKDIATAQMRLSQALKRIREENTSEERKQ